MELPVGKKGTSEWWHLMTTALGVLAVLLGLAASFGGLVLAVANSPLVGPTGDLAAVMVWASVGVFGVLLFGSGIASSLSPT